MSFTDSSNNLGIIKSSDRFETLYLNYGVFYTKRYVKALSKKFSNNKICVSIINQIVSKASNNRLYFSIKENFPLL